MVLPFLYLTIIRITTQNIFDVMILCNYKILLKVCYLYINIYVYMSVKMFSIEQLNFSVIKSNHRARVLSINENKIKIG